MEIVFLALVTAFILFRLFKVLGTIDEDEKDAQYSEFEEVMREIQKAQGMGDTIDIADAFEAQFPPEFRDQFDKFRKIDENFSAKSLFEKATKAFEIIVVALNNHDLKTLKPLLSDKVYKAFAQEVKRRKNDNEKLSIEILSHENSTIKSASIAQSSTARVVFLFKTDQKIHTGSSNEIVSVEDTWVFEKNLKDKSNPVWKLVAT